ncbi:MAG: 4Fe-4S dicluster domain-containing protein [Alphaproteobacteria bacterium]|nr:4Fe-4S dicluster domain-containing protein [Alphaproteobacteria bacterium]MCB9697553.1 4Fe-4S dicluster domain-containing protein [Alphaproteobacteria bacterium]
MRESDVEKVRRASAHPDRPGEVCRADAGVWKVAVDVHRCEGKGDCVVVCPYQVFEVGPIDEGVYASLPMLTRLKLWVHGKKTAHLPRADACKACGLCVVACPEGAVSLSAP